MNFQWEVLACVFAKVSGILNEYEKQEKGESMGLPLNTGFINLTNNMPAVATAEEHSLSQKGDPLV